MPRHYLHNPTYAVFQEMKRQIKEVQGKRILEYGCGEGWTTAEIAERGATVECFDISDTAVQSAALFLKERGLSGQCVLRKMAAEYLDYPDNSFDIVFGFAILHHLDLSKAMPELHRVLKPSGVAYFAEPLGTNPLINVYRRMTPLYRTALEQPIIMEEFAEHASPFTLFRHTEYYFTALLPLALSYLPVVPDRFIAASMAQLNRFDRSLLNRFPSLGRFAWYTIIHLAK